VSRQVRVITIGLGNYHAAPSWNVEEAEASREKVATLFAEHGASVADWTPKATTKKIPPSLETWTKTTDEATILYWIGHGQYSADGYILALADSCQPLNTRNGLTGTALAEAVRDRQRRRGDVHLGDWVLLILDSCGSRPGSDDIWSSLRPDRPPNTGVIGTAEGDGAAQAGAFADMLETVLAGFGGNDDGVSIKELMRRLEDLLETGDAPRKRVQHVFSPSARLPGRRDSPPLQITVDLYAELRTVLDAAPPQLRNHFYAKAQGGEIGELAWHFTGRDSERRAVVNWLRHTDGGMFVVSGIAGSGKSALLGMLLASSDKQLMTALESAGYKPVPTELRPARPFDAVVHLSGHTIADTVAALATGLGLEFTDDPDTLVDAARAAASSVEGWSVMLDALDEARDPLPIASLVRRLAVIGRLRLIVGTRQSLHEDPDTPTPPDSVVLDTLAAPPEQVIKLPRDQIAVHRYVRERLRSRLPAVAADQVNDLADAIAIVDQPFLFARLAVNEIIADPAWSAPDADLTGLLSTGHSGIFGQAIARLRNLSPNVEALLHALAYARGNGFPRTGGIWAVAASALTDATINDQDVARTLREAAPYIMQDTEFGHSVYRLAHRTFTERYRMTDNAV